MNNAIKSLVITLCLFGALFNSIFLLQSIAFGALVFPTINRLMIIVVAVVLIITFIKNGRLMVLSYIGFCVYVILSTLSTITYMIKYDYYLWNIVIPLIAGLACGILKALFDSNSITEEDYIRSKADIIKRI